MVSFPYYSHTTPIRIPKDMGMVWEAYHKGVPLLGVPGITLDWVTTKLNSIYAAAATAGFPFFVNCFLNNVIYLANPSTKIYVDTCSIYDLCVIADGSEIWLTTCNYSSFMPPLFTFIPPFGSIFVDFSPPSTVVYMFVNQDAWNSQRKIVVNASSSGMRMPPNKGGGTRRVSSDQNRSYML